MENSANQSIDEMDEIYVTIAELAKASTTAAVMFGGERVKVAKSGYMKLLSFAARAEIAARPSVAAPSVELPQAATPVPADVPPAKVKSVKGPKKVTNQSKTAKPKIAGNVTAQAPVRSSPRLQEKTSATKTPVTNGTVNHSQSAPPLQGERAEAPETPLKPRKPQAASEKKSGSARGTVEEVFLATEVEKTLNAMAKDAELFLFVEAVRGGHIEEEIRMTWKDDQVEEMAEKCGLSLDADYAACVKEMAKQRRLELLRDRGDTTRGARFTVSEMRAICLAFSFDGCSSLDSKDLCERLAEEWSRLAGKLVVELQLPEKVIPTESDISALLQMSATQLETVLNGMDETRPEALKWSKYGRLLCVVVVFFLAMRSSNVDF